MAIGLTNLLLGRLPSYTRKSRHFQLLTRYGTIGKLSNLASVELSRVRGDIVVRGRPYVYTIDTGNLCNLRCPLCPTGYRGLERPQALMSLDTFRTIIDKIQPYAVEAILHNWGEPFLNPDILAMVSYAQSVGVGTALSSNMNLVNRDRGFLEAVVHSGLDHLTVSLDGTTQEVYETYRRGGSLEHVLKNVRYLLDYRERVGSRTPRVEWQFLVMKHNQHQRGDAARLARELGVDELRFTGAGLPFNNFSDPQLTRQWLSDLPSYRGYAADKVAERGYLYDEKCFYLYRAMTVNPLGEVSPCCVLYHERFDFGNLLTAELEDVWNNSYYRSSRALFSRRKFADGAETACHRCPLFRYESPRHSHISSS